MNKKVILSLGLAMLAQIGFSQSDTTQNTSEMDEVVLTASKIPVNKEQSAKPVLVIDEATIEKSSGKSLAQLLDEQVGLNVNNGNGTPGSILSVYLRGASQKHTLILINGMPATDPSSISGFDLRSISLGQIKRIEILKGSQSTLYGTNATAGVINIITKDSSKDLISGNGSISAGTHNTFNANANVNGNYKGIGYLVGYQKSYSEGISAAKSEDGENFENDSYDKQSFNTQLSYKYKETFKIQPFFRFSELDADYDGGAYTDADNNYLMKFLNTGTQISAEFDNVAVYGNYNYSWSERSFIDNYPSKFKGATHHIDLYGRYDITKNITALVGGNYQSFQIRENNNPEHVNPLVTIVSPYASILISDLKGFSAEIGGRYNNHSKFGNYSTFNIAPAYKINDKYKAFASIGTGFNAPTLSNLYGQWGPNENLKPETSTTYEIGLETKQLDDKLTASITYFSRDFENLIIWNDEDGWQGPIPAQYINQDEQHDEGVEVTADFKICKSFSINGSYTFLDGYGLNKGGDEDVKTYNLYKRPKHAALLGANITPCKNWELSAQANYNGQRFVNTTQTLSPYILVNLYSSYKISEKTTVFVDAKNLLNHEYVQTLGYNTLRRNVQAGIRASF